VPRLWPERPAAIAARAARRRRGRPRAAVVWAASCTLAACALCAVAGGGNTDSVGPPLRSRPLGRRVAEGGADPLLEGAGTAKGLVGRGAAPRDWAWPAWRTLPVRRCCWEAGAAVGHARPATGRSLSGGCCGGS